MITNDPYGIDRACRPWDRRCFNCPFPDDCHPERCRGSRGGRPPKTNIDDIRRLHGQGMNDSEIARVLGVTASTVWFRRQQMCLPANPRRRQKRDGSR